MSSYGFWMYRYILRNGDVMMSDLSPESFETYFYLSGLNERTWALSTEQSELSFLLSKGSQNHFHYV